MKRLVMALMAFVFLMSAVFVLPACAETVFRDGIEVTLMTDKENYDSMEAINARLAITNTNRYAVQDVSSVITAPDGYVLNGNAEEEHGTLRAGQSQTQEAAVYQADYVPNLPKTGDNSHGILWGLLFVLSSVVLCAMVIHNPHAKRFFSLFLCLVMISTLVLEAVPVVAESAHETEIIIVSKTVLVNGKEVLLTGTVTYEADVQTVQGVAGPTISGEKINDTAEYVKVREGDTLSFTGKIKASEGAMISTVQVFVYDADTEVPYSMGEKYYTVAGVNTAEFDLSVIPEMTIGEAFGPSDYALTEGKRYAVMFYATDSNGNGFADMDAQVAGNQGPVISVRVLLPVDKCDHSAKEYTYERDEYTAPRITDNGDGLTHLVEDSYKRYCADCGAYLMNIWSTGMVQEHVMDNNVCMACGYMPEIALTYLLVQGEQYSWGNTIHLISGDCINVVFEEGFIGEKNWSVISYSEHGSASVTSGLGNGTVYFGIFDSLYDEVEPDEAYFRITRSDGEYVDIVVYPSYGHYGKDEPFLCMNSSKAYVGNSFSSNEMIIGEYVSFYTNRKWCVSSDQVWCEIIDSSSKNVTGIWCEDESSDGSGVSLAVNLAENTEYQSRECIITVSAEDCDSYTYTIVQQGKEEKPYITLSTSNVYGTHPVNSRDITVYSNCDWDVEVLTNKSFVDAERRDDKIHLSWARYRYYHDVTSIIKVFADDCEPQYLYFTRAGGTMSFGDQYYIDAVPSSFLLTSISPWTDNSTGAFVSWNATTNSDSITLSQYEGLKDNVPLYVNCQANDTGYYRDLIVTIEMHCENSTETKVISIKQPPYVDCEGVEFQYLVGCDETTLSDVWLPTYDKDVITMQISAPDWIEVQSNITYPWDCDILVAQNKGIARRGEIVCNYCHIDGYTIKSRVVEVIQRGADGSMIPSDTTAPIINPINSSAGTEFVANTTVTFTTAAADETALSKIELFIDGELKKAMNVSGLSAEISYTTSELTIGDHIVKVVATDAAGWYNEVTISLKVIPPTSETCTHQNTNVLTTETLVYVDETHHKIVYTDWTHCIDCDTGISHTTRDGATVVHGPWKDDICSCGYDRSNCQHTPSDIKTYNRHLFAPLNEKQHQTIAIVWDMVCSTCGKTYEEIDTVGDENNPIGLPYDHVWEDGKCKVLGCEYQCEHAFEDIMLPDGNHKAENGIWESKGESGHWCTSIEWWEKCINCGLEQKYTQNDPYNGEMQPHKKHTTTATSYRYYDEYEHQMYTTETTYCGGCDWKKVEEKPADYRAAHVYENGVCLAEGCGAKKPEEPNDGNAESSNRVSGSNEDAGTNQGYIFAGDPYISLNYEGKDYPLLMPTYDEKSGSNSAEINGWKTVATQEIELDNHGYSVDWASWIGGVQDIGKPIDDDDGSLPFGTEYSSGLTGKGVGSVRQKGYAAIAILQMLESIYENTTMTSVRVVYQEKGNQRRAFFEVASVTGSQTRQDFDFVQALIDRGTSPIDPMYQKYGTRMLYDWRNIADEELRERFPDVEFKDGYVYNLEINYSEDWNRDKYFAQIGQDEDGNWLYSYEIKPDDEYILVGKKFGLWEPEVHVVDITPKELTAMELNKEGIRAIEDMCRRIN